MTGDAPTALLSSPVQRLKGTGPALAKALARLGIYSLQDLLFHLPSRYQDRTALTPVAALDHGVEAVVQGEVLSADITLGRRRMLLVKLTDGTGTFQMRLFHFSAGQHAQFVRGHWVRCFGEVRVSPTGRELIHPEYTHISGPDEPLSTSLTPVYPLTEGVTQPRLVKLTSQALELLGAHSALLELLPESALASLHLPCLADALRYVHRPPPDAPVNLLLEGVHPAQKRLAFEELVAHHLALFRLRRELRRRQAPVIPPSVRLLPALKQQLPFSPTQAQQRVCAEITHDLSQPYPMLRLVQGDVGSGKTLVAFMAALQAIEQGWQVALMAPTELLAEQHFHTLSAWCQPLGICIRWLAGKMTGKARQEILDDLVAGRIALLVGTHALFQSGVDYARLGLVIIDEQHRFGVHQRLELKRKGEHADCVPHQLIMTATPIPRTLAMSVYADLDTSVIDELPPGRKPITTAVIDNARRDEVMERVYHACQEGKQVYWVCTLIEESEQLQCQAAEEAARELQDTLSNLRVGLVHGRMKSSEKTAVMSAFQAGEIDILVATTVIEVGVNVPNASVMVIENPERLGLAQLHQLRGRVGRGSQQSFCVLLYQAPLGKLGRARLEVLRTTQDGFVIARKDLELRGPGEMLGTRQTGEMNFRIADLLRDEAHLDAARELAEHMLDAHPHRVSALINRWLGQALNYAQV